MTCEGIFKPTSVVEYLMDGKWVRLYPRSGWRKRFAKVSASTGVHQSESRGISLDPAQGPNNVTGVFMRFASIKGL
jgi:hypothetical protein